MLWRPNPMYRDRLKGWYTWLRDVFSCSCLTFLPGPGLTKSASLYSGPCRRGGEIKKGDCRPDALKLNGARGSFHRGHSPVPGRTNGRPGPVQIYFKEGLGPVLLQSNQLNGSPHNGSIWLMVQVLECLLSKTCQLMVQSA